MRVPKAFRLKSDRVLHGEVKAKAGDTVYECWSYDYGCAADDTRGLGVPHVSVTLLASGDYPFFTVPASDLEAAA